MPSLLTAPGVCTAAYRDGMQRPELDDDQRSQAARIAVMINEFGAGSGPDALPAQALPELRAISRDPVVLGDVLGDYLHRVVVGTQAETMRYWPTLELLRAAGADEQRAAAKALWLRHQDADHQAEHSSEPV
jgi:hypothetical protein